MHDKYRQNLHIPSGRAHFIRQRIALQSDMDLCVELPSPTMM